MKTLIIDNYDSFTYNLAHLIADINQREPMVVRNDATTWQALAAEQFDNIIISPGPGRPDRAIDFGLSADAIAKADVPLLGVCLGFQGIAMAAGAQLAHAPALVHGSASPMTHNGNVLFDGIESPFDGGRYHSFVIERPVPDALEEIAWTDDGLLMAFARRDRPQWGVQFHPESILTPSGRRLLENFRDITRGRAHDKLSTLYLAPDPAPVHTRSQTPREAIWRELPTAIDVDAVFSSLYANAPRAFWLDRAMVAPALSRWSYLGEASEALSYRCADGFVAIKNGDDERREQGSIFDVLQRQTFDAASSLPCPFAGGLIGWFGYELQQDCGSSVRRTAATPDALLMRVDRFIAVDHLDGKTYICAVDEPETELNVVRWLDETSKAIAHAVAPTLATSSREQPLEFLMAQDEAAYQSSVASCLQSIREGESYQVCLTNELSCEANVDPLDVYRAMRRVNPAPFAAYIKWPEGAVLSASPERFLSADAQGRVETKPIKGTIRRDPDPIRDQELVAKLRSNPKDRAENAMIVDLLRNDLSRCCEPGSVKAAKLFDVETYETVHQLVSTVTGQLKAGQTIVDLLRAAFPGGSMTGAPKLRTLEIIDRLEQRPRGIYSGALGWIGNDAAADLSIVIRSIIAADGKFSIGVGGGVVAGSTPQGEFDEMLLKAQASIKALVTAVFGHFTNDLYRVVGAALKDK